MAMAPSASLTTSCRITQPRQSTQAHRQRGCFAAKPATRIPRQRGGSARVEAYLTKHSAAALQQTVLHFVEASNRHDMGALTSYLTPQVVWSDRVWCSVDLRGTDKVRKVYHELWTSYPDYTLHVEDVLARDDSNTVAVHFTATGTNFGEWRGYPASGRRSTSSGVSLFVFDTECDDRIRQIITYRQPSAEEYALYLGHEEI